MQIRDNQAFEDALDRFGGDLARWPEAARADAERLLGSSSEARALKAEMDAVEAVLRTPPASTDMAFTGMAFTDTASVAMRQRQMRVHLARRPLVRQATAWGVATVAALVLGIVLGNLQSIGKTSYDARDETPDQVVAGALGMPGTTDVD